jgi:hypothetical protein
VHVVVFCVAFDQDGTDVAAHLAEDASQVADELASQHTPLVLGPKDQVNVQSRNNMPATAPRREWLVTVISEP